MEVAMKGWQIFTHSVRQVFGNLEGALRTSAVLYLVQTAVGFLLVGGLLMGAGSPEDVLSGGGAAGLGIGMVIVFLVAILTGFWIAVGWHRFVLLGETSPLVPTFQGDRIWAYFLRSLGYGLILLLVGVVWGGVVGFLVGSLFSTSVVAALTLLAILVYLPLLVIGFRLSCDLPAAALGADMPFFSGWKATAGQSGDIAMLALIIVGSVVVIELIGSYVLGPYAILSFAWSIVTGWVAMMVGVSILTTLYGHYIEKRALV
jgi:hypothetical protein